ncbi:MAG: stage III sporulation protein AF [Oscillospiraceae bacterium]|nr:stage III sporulation protein AF [Oscillospiraceae bacterium]
MGMIKEWAVSLCGCAVCCSLIGMLLPQGSIQKLFKLLTTVVILSCIVSPLMNLKLKLPDTDFDESYAEIEEYTLQAEEAAHEIAVEAVQAQVKKIISERLGKIHVVPENVQVNVHNDDEDNISYIEAVIELNEKDASFKQEIQSLIHSELGIECSFE